MMSEELIKQWNEIGINTLDKEYQELWIKIVPVRLDDLYNGMELKASIDIIKELNNGCSIEQAESIIESQGHSGMSYGLVRSMVKQLCKRGEEFVAYTRRK